MIITNSGGSGPPAGLHFYSDLLIFDYLKYTNLSYRDATLLGL